MGKRKPVANLIKHVIIYHGEENSGKTTTLIELGRMLLPESDHYSEWNLRKLLKRKGKGKDIGIEREIMAEWNGCQIYIYTMGDGKADVQKVVKGRANGKDAVSIIASRWDSKALGLGKLNGVQIVDVPSVKKIDPAQRGTACYTTARELYLHLMHIITTGTF